MAFNSIEYAILFLISFGGFWLLADRRKLRTIWLLAASYLFYASWNPKYLVLIFGSSSLDYFIGKRMHNTASTTTRKELLALSVIVNLGILCTFKYYNFFASEFTTLLATFNIKANPWMLKTALPVGISFYTFQTLSYTIDIYRKKLTPTESYFEYLLFVSFFPQLVAGPIVRASKLLPQLGKVPQITAQTGGHAIFLIAIGLIKKIAVADYLACHLVDPVFSNPQMYSSIETLVATYAYAFQIYADFSAYSDIAIGSAALLGFELPINFNVPYTASNLREFWQKWHISLSTWLRDYLYIPLGGSKNGSFRTYVNLLITMLLGGLWHGAALTFVFWGAIHGLALVGTRIIQRSRVLTKIPQKIKRILGVIITFHVVCAAWIFFRSPDFSTASQMFETIFALEFGIANITTPATIMLAAAAISHWIPHQWMNAVKERFIQSPAPLQAAAVVGVIFAVNQLAKTDVTPFIYFQF